MVYGGLFLSFLSICNLSYDGLWGGDGRGCMRKWDRGRKIGGGGIEGNHGQC